MNFNMVNGRIQEMKQKGVRSDFVQDKENDHIMFYPTAKRIKFYMAFGLMILALLGEGTRFYIQQKDTTKVVNILKGKVRDMKIDTTLTKQYQNILLHHLLRKVDPENAERLIKESEERMKETIKELQESLKNSDQKEK